MTTEEQDYFNQAFLGLRQQGFKKSRQAESGDCAYRGDNGLKCAIGHRITDEQYDPAMDACTWNHGEFQAHGLFLDMSRELLFNRMQSAHDAADNPADMEFRLRKVAADFGLTVPA